MSKVSNIDTSRISKTNLYTGYVWKRHGLAPPELVPLKAGLFYNAFSIIANSLRIIFKLNLEAFLLQRHIIIDKLLEEEIQKHPNTTVVEIASGYSPRGDSFMSKFGHLGLQYIETDLPEVATNKENLISAISHDFRPRVMACNLLAEDGDLCLENILKKNVSPERHLIFITEGLINYFDFDVLEKVFRRMTNILKKYDSGCYITDITAKNVNQPRFKIIELVVKFIGFIAKGKVFLHGEDEQSIVNSFKKFGFVNAIVYNPKDFLEILPAVAKEKFPVIRILKCML